MPAAAASPTTGAFPPNALQPQMSGGPIRVPPLQPDKVAQYSGLFERSGAQNGLLDGATAKAIFERAGLPNEVLGRIWNLADREQKGALDVTEFIVAMHLLTSYKSRQMTALPSVLPPGLYEAAARRGAPPPPSSRQGPPAGAIPRQFTGQSAGQPVRTQSPLARPPGYATPPPQSAQTTGTPWLITPQEKDKYDQFFATVDTQGKGVITGEQAVGFFSDSGLPEDTLASIWDLADINSEGQLNRDEFAVAMYLIRQQRSQNKAPLPAFLPAALVPPAMRKQQHPPSQPTAPTFDNAANSSNLPKGAAEDLFGLDQPSPPQQQQQPAPLQTQQTTGGSAALNRSFDKDPFGGSQPVSPSSPQRFQPQPQAPGSIFKPFMPTSAFGASLASQNTGGSTTSQGQARGFPQQQQQQRPQQVSAMDDLLGDNDAEESNKLTNETTELANMSNQIGNLRNQMQDVQTKKETTQKDLTATSTQRRDLELRLSQFRTQYEQEVKAVKELEAQLATSRADTKNLQQQLAMIEGTHQDLQTQHQQVSQALQADQQENATLKEKIAQLNQEVNQLKPQLEKMRSDARQQKGMVAINKKQLATTEGEKDKLQAERVDLTREAEEREAQQKAAQEEEASRARSVEPTVASNVASPAPSTMSSTNPFFRKTSGDKGVGEGTMSPSGFMATAPSPSAFDALFGPSFAHSQQQSRTNTPPLTSFGGQQRAVPAFSEPSGQSVSSEGRPTPSATPPLSAKEESPQSGEPPAPPENRQFTSNQLPMRNLPARSDSLASSAKVIPPASRVGGSETPRDFTSGAASPAPAASPFEAAQRSEAGPSVFAQSFSGFDSAQPPMAGTSAVASEPTTETKEVEAQPEPAERDTIPGAFPDDGAVQTSSSLDGENTAEKSVEQPMAPEPSTSAPKDDFESAFAGFGNAPAAPESEKSADPFAAMSSAQLAGVRGVASEFPPIESLEHEDESESEDEDKMHPGFDDNFTAVSPPRNGVPATHGVAEPTVPATAEPAREVVEQVRPTVNPIASTASELPQITAQTSPPTYEQSNSPAYGGHGEEQPGSFPREFGGLLPSREDPTSPTSPPPAVQAPQSRDIEKPLQTPTTSGHSLFPNVHTPASTSGSDIYQDASSRPMSSFTDAGQSVSQAQSSQPPIMTNNAFDDFEFGDLDEAKEADEYPGFHGHVREGADEFNPTFDSPAASMTNTMASSQQTPTTRTVQPDSGFHDFERSLSQPSTSAFGGSQSSQQTPQAGSHDWDAIFSGLDAPTKGVDTSFGNDGSPFGGSSQPAASETARTADNSFGQSSSPFGGSSTQAPLATPKASSPTSTRQQMPPLGRALTPGTEHDDPILKRLTGMGYPRQEALNALEMYDYDINRVSVELETFHSTRKANCETGC